MPDRMTWAEICERFPDEWVCLAEIEHEPSSGFGIHSARLLDHGKTRREALAHAQHWWRSYPVIAHFFTGTLTPASPRSPRIEWTDEMASASGRLSGPGATTRTRAPG